MSSGAALSTPREHLNNIENALKATGLFAATARIGIGAAGKAYPLGSLLTSVQQHRLLSQSLLEQGLSILTPNNPTSASFAAAEFIPFSAWYSQRWKVAYEHESLCKLHTAYNHPGRFGTKGRCFYKLENYIADLCIVKPLYF